MNSDENRLIHEFFAAWIDSHTAESADEHDAPIELPEASELGTLFERTAECADALHAAWPDGSNTSAASSSPASVSQEVDGAAPPSEIEPQHFGRFEIIRLLGRGGMGAVFLAFDPHIGRKVALKIPHPGSLIHDEVRERFLREARAAGALRHPGIVPVFESGSRQSCCYLVSEFCDGPTLAEWQHQRDDPVEPRMAARIAARLGDAIQHAHDNGILHRDLKPSNVLLDQFDADTDNAPTAGGDPAGEGLPFVPRVTDFGLAHLIGDDALLTRSGTAIGTAAYMSPEQSLGRREVIGPRSDVFSLGAMLYEMLTGDPPFGRESGFATVAALRQSEPASPRRRRRDVDRDLEAICLKALEKQPDRRYGSAAEFSADLRRYVAGESTVARPLSNLGRLLRRARRSPATAALVLVLVLAPLGLAIGQWIHSGQLSAALSQTQTERMRAERQQRRAEAGELRARQLLYASDMLRAIRAWHEKDHHTALELLDEHLPAAGEPDLRGVEWHFLDASCRPRPEIELRHGAAIRHCAATPDGRRLITAGDDGYLRVWDLAARKLVGEVKAHETAVHSVAISPDGAQAVSGGDDKVELWDLATLCRVRLLGEHPTGIETVAWSADGKLIASGARYSDVRVWSPDSGLIMTIEDDGRHESLVFSRDGERLYLPQKFQLAVWNIPQRKQERLLNPNVHYGPRAMCALDHGRLLACSNGFRAEIAVIDVSSGIVVAHLTGDCDYSRGFAASPRGRYLASAGEDGVVRLFDVSDLKDVESTPTSSAPPLNRGVDSAAMAHAGMITSVSFVDENRIVTTGEDGRALVWNVERLADWRRWGPAAGAQRVNLTNDAQTLLIGDAAREAPTIVDGETSNRRSDSEGPGKGVIAPNQRWFANVQSNGEVVIWDLFANRVHGRLPTHGTTPEQTVVRDLAFSPAGPLLALVHLDCPLEIWNVETMKLVRRLETDPSNFPVRFSNDGQWLATSDDHGVVIWDWSQERVIYRDNTKLAYTLAWSPDDRILAAAGNDRTIRLWNTTNWQTTNFIGHKEGVRCLKFSPDGRTLISGDLAGAVRLWHLPSQRPMGVLFQSPWPREAIRDFALPDGGRFLAIAVDGAHRGSVLVSSAFGEPGL